ncbi:MAG: YebC/PmpR family DNA-binding transcriptional regulator, partial [Phycisphaerae bacterium]|nr:YebC/PmpR family DNA-binding transcriptional regulator [Phycisphaerae bacterium]
GHSHWATIRRKKSAADAKRGKLFSKLARNIMVAAKNGGGDPDTNLALRYAIDKAKGANMPNDNIAKAIKKGTGELGGVQLEEIVYEGYAPGGVAILCEVLTDNRNRTASEIRKIFELKGGSLAGAKSVAWKFEKKGLFAISRQAVDEETLMEIVLDAGADDLTSEQKTCEVTCPPASFGAVSAALAEKGIVPEVAEISMIAQTTISLDAVNLRKVLSLLEALEDQDDVQNVYSDLDIPEELMTQISEESA